MKFQKNKQTKSSSEPRDLLPRERFVDGRHAVRLQVGARELAELAEDGPRLDGARATKQPGHLLRLHALRLRLGQRAPAADADAGALHVRAAQHDVDAGVVRGAHYTSRRERYRSVPQALLVHVHLHHKSERVAREDIQTGRKVWFWKTLSEKATGK